jgi:hypothetical protein
VPLRLRKPRPIDAARRRAGLLATSQPDLEELRTW